MFPKYSEVVKVSFTQVVANHLTDEFTPSEVAKMHAEFLSAMNALIPNGEVIKFSIDRSGGSSEVKIYCGEGEHDWFIVGIIANFETQQVETYVV